VRFVKLLRFFTFLLCMSFLFAALPMKGIAMEQSRNKHNTSPLEKQKAKQQSCDFEIKVQTSLPAHAPSVIFDEHWVDLLVVSNKLHFVEQPAGFKPVVCHLPERRILLTRIAPPMAP